VVVFQPLLALLVGAAIFAVLGAVACQIRAGMLGGEGVKAYLGRETANCKDCQSYIESEARRIV
jgi:hypothetical protein